MASGTPGIEGEGVKRCIGLCKTEPHRQFCAVPAWVLRRETGAVSGRHGCGVEVLERLPLLVRGRVRGEQMD